MRDIAATYRFGAFTLDTGDRQLARDGEPVELGSRYFDALVLLVGERGGLVSKDRFMDEVWRGIPVTDEALTQCIRTLRRALGDEAANPRFIRTVPKHGYRFVGELEDEPEPVEEPPANAPARYALPSRVVGACTLAGLAAGVMGGGFYGIAASEGQALILAAMIGCLGLLAGAALGASLGATLAWRGKADAILLPAAALGGLTVGALGNTLGREGVRLLTGQQVWDVTGPTEGALVGLATGFIAWLALRPSSKPLVIGAAVLLGGVTGVAIRLAGGTLLAGSLLSLQYGLPDTQLALERIGLALTDAGWETPAHLMATVIEGAVFVTALASGLLLARRINA